MATFTGIAASIVGFLVSLLVGALGIYIGASLIAKVEDYTYAIVTALIGSLVWWLLGWVPFLGPILALVAYIWVINRRYPGGWGSAIGIALVAWLATLVVVFILAFVGLVPADVTGVPGV
ncbi:hypothetical protein [Halomarina litorea]|uniref:hypothetical protein n=1 Tax=Halomarina litorea TaxID=2961595 RepID=UPI0020C22593|nr:hypothetical protein [Halomarina sp. BCD28]